MQMMTNIVHGALELPAGKTGRPYLLHMPCGDGSAAAPLREKTNMVILGAESDKKLYKKANELLHQTENATPASVRVHPQRSVQVLWLSPGSYHVASALEGIGPSLQYHTVFFFHLNLDQITKPLAIWLQTKTNGTQYFSLPGQAMANTRLVMGYYDPTMHRVATRVESFIEHLKGTLPVYPNEAPVRYNVQKNSTSTIPHLYSSTTHLEDIADALKKSALWQHPAMVKELTPVQILPPKPLLPVKPGHVALQISAGLLNGHEITYHGKRLLIKGNTVKKSTTYTDEELDQNGNPQVVTRMVESFSTKIKALDLDDGSLYDIQ